MYLVTLDPILQTSIAVWIQVVCPHEDFLSSRWKSKRSHSSHYVTHSLYLFKHLNQPSMFCVEPAVPVYFGVIEAEDTIFLLELHVHVWVSGEKFILECAILARCTNFVNLVDDGAHMWDLVKKHFRYEAFVG